MTEVYGYNAHLHYCEQCHGYEEGYPPERCTVGEALYERERMSDTYDEGGEG